MTACRGRIRLSSPREIFSLDLRSLALFRLGLGLVLVFDLCSRLGDVRAHYTDYGILPRALHVQDYAYLPSLHLAGGSLSIQAALFTIALTFAGALLFGYRTRLATIVSWVLTVSIQNRNPLILHGGDDVLRLLLFWGMFLPLGSRYSVDATLAARGAGEGAARTNPSRESSRYWGGASLALTLQIVFLYLFAALHKTGSEWWPEGTAGYYTLSLDQMTSSLGVSLSRHHAVLRFGTYCVYVLELMSPVLLLSPLFYVPLRVFGVLTYTTMHLVFAATLEMGFFPWIGIVGVGALIPGGVWDALSARLPAWILVPPANQHQGVGASPPGTVRDAALGPSQESSREIAATDRRSRRNWLGDAIAVLLIGYVGLWNLYGLSSPRSSRLAGPLSALGVLLRLDQKWAMFSPRPPNDHGWWVIEGELDDGTPVDVLRHSTGPASREKPRLVSATFPSVRWRKYMEYML